LKGPAHTGRVPNLSPSSRAAFGEIIMPERSVRAAISGTSGSARLNRTVRSLTTSTLLISPISLLRNEPGVDRWRSMLKRTASALNGSPSWNLTPGRSLITTERPPAAHSYPVASCGTILRSGVTSKSLSQSAAKTRRPT